MIKKITLENFQSHPSSEFKLHAGVNAIVGASDNGKSAVIRALRWVVENNPAGTAHISDWIKTENGSVKTGHSCRVTLETDAQKITRIRGDENSYTVGDTVLSAVRSDVPIQVSDALNFGETNIQLQMDAPFLISQPAGEVARFFNRVVKLEDIDKALTIAEAKKRDANADIRLKEAQKLEIEEKLEGLAWVDVVGPMLDEKEELEGEQSKANATIEALEEGVRRLSSIAMELRGLEGVLRLGDLVESARGAQSSLDTVMRRISGVSRLEGDLRREERVLEECRGYIDLAPTVESARKAEGEYQATAKKLQGLGVLVERWEALRVDDSILVVSELVEQSRAVDVAGVDVRLRGLRGIVEQWEGLGVEDGVLAVAGLVEQAREVASDVEQGERRLRGLQGLLLRVEDADAGKWDAELERLVAMRPDVCPTCGGRFGHD